MGDWLKKSIAAVITPFGFGVASMTGGGALFGLSFYEHIIGASVSPYSFFVFGCVLFCFGFVMLKKNQIETLTRQVDAIGKPWLFLEVDRAIYSEVNSHLFLRCAVINRSPTLASLSSIVLEDRRTNRPTHVQSSLGVDGRYIYDPRVKDFTMMVNDKGRTESWATRKEQISSLLCDLSEPPPQGKQVHGWVAFPLCFPHDQGALRIFDFAIQYTDTLGNSYGPTGVSATLERFTIL